MSTDNTPKVLVTVDVEADDLWSHPKDPTFENIRAISKFQSFCERFGLRPTYLVDYPVAVEEIGRKVFRPIAKSGMAEIGSHMHVWTTPPLVPVTPEDHVYSPLATEVSLDVLTAKMINVTQAVGELCGASPRSHRAGRFAFDGRSLALLERLGYTVDSSVTPLQSWRERAHDGGWRGPDFSPAPFEPYFPSRDDVSRPGDSPILEVPVSFFLTRPLPARFARWYARLPRNNNFVRALRWGGYVRHAPLRPGRDVSIRMLLGVAEALVAAGIPFLNLMFHSSEVAVGTSPHTRTQAELEESYDQLRVLFEYLVYDVGTQSVTLSECTAFHGTRPSQTAPDARSKPDGR